MDGEDRIRFGGVEVDLKEVMARGELEALSSRLKRERCPVCTKRNYPSRPTVAAYPDRIEVTYWHDAGRETFCTFDLRELQPMLVDRELAELAKKAEPDRERAARGILPNEPLPPSR